MSKSLKTIAKTIDRIFHKNASVVAQNFGADMVQEIAIDTPVDTGRATAGWVADINTVPQSDSKETDKGNMATKTKNKAKKALRGINVNQNIFISNNVFDSSQEGEEDGYIIKLENGASSQAPTGMFRKNVIRADRIVKKTVKKLI